MPDILRRLHPGAVLAAAMLVAAGLILLWAGDRTFGLDEWDYVINRGDWTLNNLLRPANGHLLALPLLVYKGLLSAFGATSHLPFTLLTVVLHLTVSGLVYVIAARRIGPWPALLPAVLILFLGAGWEVMLNTGAMQNQFGMAAGLGMLLCLDRGDRRGDVLAGILLAVSLASFTIGVAFAAGAIVRLVLDRPERPDPRRFALVAVPVIAYAVWFVWARQYPGTGISAYSLGSLAGGVFDQVNGITAGLTGLFRQTGAPDLSTSLILDVDRTTFLALALIALLVFRVLRPPAPSRAAWSALTVLVAYLLLIGAGLDELRVADASRYVYMGSVLLLVSFVELIAGFTMKRGWVLAATAAVAVSLLGNVAQINTGGNFFEGDSALNRAELTALELTRDTVPPAFIVEGDLKPGIYPHGDLLFPAADYFPVADRFGSPAYTEEELVTAPEEARGAADAALVGALGITVAPGPAAGSEGSGPAPTVVNALNAEISTDGSCLTARPLGPGPLYLTTELAPGGFTFDSQSKPTLLGLRRFAAGDPVELAAGPAGTVAIPADASARPWQGLFGFPGDVSICSIGEGADSGGD